MKTHFNLSFIALLFFTFTFSQNDFGKSDDQARIVLNTFISDGVLESTPNARKLFITKLSQITSRNGLGGSSANKNNRFIISGDLNVLTKDILPTAPPKYAVTIEANLAVGDGIDGKTIASEFIEFKGVGVSEDKAFIAAIRKINPRHKMVKELLENGKQRIIEYYNSQCDFLAKEASTLSELREFDQAVFTLSQVPKAVKGCYDSSMDLAVEITRKNLNLNVKRKSLKPNL